MDNKTFKKLKLQTVKATRTYQPFHKLVKNKVVIKDLQNHPGWKLVEEYLKFLVELNTDELKNNYLNKNARDVSDIIRGKLEGLEGILKIYEAIDGYIQLEEEVSKIEAEEEEKKKGS